MRRLNHPVYRNRVLQVAADAGLVALAYFLAFQLRFLDQPHGWPHRYEVLFAQSSSSSASSSSSLLSGSTRSGGATSAAATSC
jgi:hypothetical protein